jgi:hypothetical protein
MWQDTIIEEIRKIREEHAAQFNYDISAIVQSLKQEEKQSGCLMVSFAQKPKISKPISHSIVIGNDTRSTGEQSRTVLK